jgi:hypothetical protein
MTEPSTAHLFLAVVSTTRNGSTLLSVALVLSLTMP